MANQITLYESVKQGLTETLEINKNILSKTFNKERAIVNCMDLFRRYNDTLKDCTKNDLVACFLKACYLGLDASNDDFYPIAYKGKLEFQMSYKGHVNFTKKYSTRPIKQIFSQVVKEGDTFEYGSNENGQYIKYVAKPFNDGAFIGVFSEVIYEDGGMSCEVMSKKDVDAVRDTYSKSYKYAKDKSTSVWTTSYNEMARKTCLKKVCKQVSVSFDSIEMQEAYNEFSDFTCEKPKAKEDVIDVFAEEDTNETIKTEVVEVKDVKDTKAVEEEKLPWEE